MNNLSGYEWFVVQSGRDVCVVVNGIQEAADSLHSCLCNCKGIRWFDCTSELIKSSVKQLFSEENWIFIDDQPFRFDSEFGHTFSRVIRLTPQKSKRQSDFNFTVPLLPPSVNHYKLPNQRGGWRITKEAQSFIDAAAIFARAAAPADWPWNIDQKTAGIRPFYEVDLIFHVERTRYLKLDSDNLEKVAFDALVKSGAISDDRYIKYHTNRALPVQVKSDERTEYSIRIVKEANT